MTRRELREHCFKMLFCADFYPAEETKQQLDRYFEAPEEDEATPEGEIQILHQVDMEEKDQAYLTGKAGGALEKLGAECAVRRMTSAQYEELETVIFAMEKAAREHDVPEYIKSDARFHDLIVAASQNKLLGRLWELCNIRSWLHVGTALTGRDLPELASRHRDIFDALQSGDLEQLRDSVDAHLGDLLEMIRERVEEPAL